MTYPTRLQGTDGIRGRVALRQSLKNPLDDYLASGFLTPDFFEAYGYAFAGLLLEAGLAEPGSPVVVGWDNRDQAGVYTGAFVKGVLKAGLAVDQVGVVPTPLVPYFMLKTGARGAAMLTASHNPADQNGIKLFLPSLGLKFLPGDDEILTGLLIAAKDLDLSVLPLLGVAQDKSAQAGRFFIGASLEPHNSWMSADLDLSNHILVLDGSNGAAAAFLEPIFGQIGLGKLRLTNLLGDINHLAGVADIEGLESISPERLEGRFRGYPFLNAFFEEAQAPAVINGEKRLVGLVFDGDADRCFRLDYDPQAGLARVSSGDLLGFQLARYAAQASPHLTEGKEFAYTVESDLLLGQAAKELGFKEQLTGVGDKWLLRQAAAAIARGQGDSELADFVSSWSFDPEASANHLTKRFETLIRRQGWRPNFPLSFFLGLEESGHALSAFWFDREGQHPPAFAGNGIKAGINSLVAMASLGLDQIREPFEAGLKATHYVYYVDKSRLNPGHLFRQALSDGLMGLIPDLLGQQFSGRFQVFAEEETLLFCHILKNGQPFGAVFVRNSGTEDKSALYLRGPHIATEPLSQLGFRLHLELLKGLKDPEKDLAKLEWALLLAIHQGQDPFSLEAKFSGLPLARVLKEMEVKQGLITQEKGVFKVDQKGSTLL